ASPVLADAHWLHQVITNLLTNALKFTPAGGRVTISTERTSADAILQVTDTGAGISTEDLPRIFDRFFRGQQAAQISGSGIGLATVAALVIGGGGFAIGAAAAEPSASGIPAAATATATQSPAATASAGPASYASVVRQVLPSVVLIRTENGLGSGVVLDRSGNIVTNAHVAGNATKFQVQVAGDTAPRSARLVGTYPPDDLAVIRADDPSGLQPATFGDSAKVQAGDVVLAIGNPLGLSGSVTQGIISATDRAVTEPAADGSPAATLPGA